METKKSGTNYPGRTRKEHIYAVVAAAPVESL